MQLLMSHLRPDFGEAVRRLLDGRGLSLRQARIRTGIDIDTIGRMRSGERVRMDKVVDFARGFGQNPNDWLELAGYPRLDTNTEPASLEGVERLVERLLALQQAHPGATIPVPRLSGGVRTLTVEEADAIADDIEDKLRRGVL